MRGQGSLELAQETRKRERKIERLVLACTIDLMNNLGLDREIIHWRF